MSKVFQRYAVVNTDHFNTGVDQTFTLRLGSGITSDTTGLKVNIATGSLEYSGTKIKVKASVGGLIGDGTDAGYLAYLKTLFTSSTMTYPLGVTSDLSLDYYSRLSIPGAGEQKSPAHGTGDYKTIQVYVFN